MPTGVGRRNGPDAMQIMQPSRRTLTSSFWLGLTLWLPAALFTFYVKWSMLHYKGFRGVALYLGRATRPGVGYEQTFSFFEILSFFHNDLLLAFGVMPLVLLLLWFIVPHRIHTILIASVSFANTSY